MNLPRLSDIDISGKRVIVRLDLDVPIRQVQGKSEIDLTRVESSQETLDYLIKNQSQILLIGHRGRPEGSDPSLSLKNLVSPLEAMLGKKIIFLENLERANFEEDAVFLLENLRFHKEEEANSDEFAKNLASLADVYVNEAFAVSHRAHASIVGIPKFLPHAAGARFVQEVEHLWKVIENPARPLVFLVSGIKEDKLKMIEEIKSHADRILVGGRLPEYLGEVNDEKLVIAQLNPDKEDITLKSIEEFEKEIARAKTIVLAGVIGKYEDEGQRLGTKRVFGAVAGTDAYKVAGGGDTEAALTIFSLTDNFDWISVGGGAMLEFLAKGTLPGIEVLLV